jgi:hypothetical protein
MAKDKGISMLRNNVKITEYNDTMFKNGFFDPICPKDYNYITGKQEYVTPPQTGLREYSLSRRVNGTSIFKN